MKKIHIFGASGSGTSTLGTSLSNELLYSHLDTDDYFWIKKFTDIREVNDRKKILKEDLLKYEKSVLSGALCGWGDSLISYFDLVIFLWIPENIRLERLQQREFERYGDEILADGSKHEQYKKFIEWASLYDSAGMEVRSKILHENWMDDLTCPVLRIEGNYTVQERVEITLEYLRSNGKQTK
ncbi:hypothetical protein [Psychrobacillus vulpis]|uniref:Adenylate kinase n=1 Tax=Psychrobacillus vulpis TaxID=2325572 RepID=A0A544TPR4_9BACI|nr:hypothetical protein [Psychrobacillus vulpis]TQR19444.1 hypothetical protein FG384_12395 [Psychrobacillus vulpis]